MCLRGQVLLDHEDGSTAALSDLQVGTQQGCSQHLFRNQLLFHFDYASSTDELVPYSAELVH